MYEYLDRRLTELRLDARLATVALRLWARAAMARECPMTPVRALFSSQGLLDAAQPAHDLYYWISIHARRRFMLGCETCGSVSEDEALLLTAMFARDETCAEHALGGLISSEAVDSGVRLARRLEQSLGPASAVDRRR